MLENDIDPDTGDDLLTCTIITTSANEATREIHDRMPVILPRQYYDPWLDPDTEIKDLNSLLTPYPAEEMMTYPVSRLVNNPKNDLPACIERADEPPRGLTS